MSTTGSDQSNPKYAWREFSGRGLPRRSASERVADFLEVHGLYDEATAREQASRCIQCPNPTCVDGCPLCNPIPQWMQLTAEGRFLEAAAVLGSVTNMAEICTRICPSDRLCEGSCILDAVSEPVAIQSIERFLMDYAFQHGQVDAATPPPNGRKVAVVGSAPGGLACAEELARRGYAVTVFDSAVIPGGLLVNGVPAFRLDRSVFQRRIELLRKRGVAFSLGVKLWSEITLDNLVADFDAVYLAVDARKARTLNIPGGQLEGVISAVSFLLQKITPVRLAVPQIDVQGKTVVVIGGGDSAIDCLRTAVRYGATEAIGVYRRGQSELRCGKTEYEDALEEGVKMVFQVSPVAVLSDTSGKVTGLKLMKTEVARPGELPMTPPEVIPGSEHELKADFVIAALGFDPVACSESAGLASLKSDSSGNVAVNARLMTSVEGVFAGGDLVRGPVNVLETVRDAREAARHMHEYVTDLQRKAGAA